MGSIKSIKRFKVDKLIRDKLPELMRSKGIVVHERVIESQEFISRLKEKLIEEAREVEQADSTLGIFKRQLREKPTRIEDFSQDRLFY
mgnify:CR=1 FL=1